MPEVARKTEPKTWRPTTAGILSIIAGAITVVIGIVVAFLGGIIQAIVTYSNVEPGILALIGVPFLVLGIVAIIGGIFALRRETWGMALAGAICAMFPLVVFGVLAMIFVSLGKREFN